jgi:hypothetical protein
MRKEIKIREESNERKNGKSVSKTNDNKSWLFEHIKIIYNLSTTMTKKIRKKKKKNQTYESIHERQGITIDLTELKALYGNIITFM